MNLVINKSAIAYPGATATHYSMLPFGDAFETFGTPFGLFIPTSTSGYQFLRWLRRGMKDMLRHDDITSRMVHVSNDGEVFIMRANTEENDISIIPVTTERFVHLHETRDIAEAYTHLLRKCKTITEAAAFIEQNEVNGLIDAQILLVEDWVAHAKEKGYTELWYRTTFGGKVIDKRQKEA